ncbi:hypothetical protein [Mycobacterium tuberculosis]|uniref:hypothetical protein n=1 Tax=Mycobacterium tuberculosis TaxID=1773 RepID=UPI00272AD038|nr:hypothetical protein [Mycobacterium tuberculosis]
MAVEWKVALPLHPEYRTLPMVWYVPPLSPITAAAQAGHLGVNGQIPDVSQLRIPLQYLANLLTAGDVEPVRIALERMLAMRAFNRRKYVAVTKRKTIIAGNWKMFKTRKEATELASAVAAGCRAGKPCRLILACNPMIVPIETKFLDRQGCKIGNTWPSELLKGGKIDPSYI